MADLNVVVLIGRVVADFECKPIPNGTSKATMRVAASRSYSSRDGERREDVVFVDVELWGKDAENAAKYLAKGSKVAIEGQLALDEWEDRDTGNKRQKHYVKAKPGGCVFLDSRPTTGGNRHPGDREREDRAPANAPREAPAETDAGVDDADLPF